MKQQRILQIVGPDMTGKTEIAKELSRVLSIPYFKASTEHATFLNQQDLFINQLIYADPRTADILSQTKASIIFDRGYPCEYAYSSVLKRKTDLDALKKVDELYSKLGTKIIVCYRSSYDGVTDDLDKSINSSILTQLELEYRRWAQQSLCDVLFLNVDDKNLKREINEILDWLGLSQPKIEAPTEEVEFTTRAIRSRCFSRNKENCSFSFCACPFYHD